MSKYVFRPYSASYPKLYEAEAAKIEPLLPEGALIEHVGSTAVPGIGRNGIIDLAIGSGDFEGVKSALIALGYEFRPQYSVEERLYFVRFDEKQRYHVHLTHSDGRLWKELTCVRDYLRGHPEALREYAAIKEKAASVEGITGEQYRALKAPFLEAILRKLF